MSRSIPAVRRVAAPQATMILALVLALGILFQAGFAGGFLGGHHVWLSWHQRLGDLLFLPPLINLLVARARRRRQHEPPWMLASRIATLALVIAVEATGHQGGGLLAVHIPAAVATTALLVHQVIVSTAARHGTSTDASTKRSRR